jgi:membrane dipeptidase
MLTRFQFLQILGLAALGRFPEGSSQASGESSRAQKDEIADLISESLVFDGVVNLGTRRGRGAQPLKPGEIKQLTGINLGNHSVSPAGFARLNSLCELHRQSLMKIERAREIEEARTGRRYGLIYYIQQGFDLKGSVEPLGAWKREGLRCLQLTYTSNELGGGTEDDELPLSAFGKRVVGELNRLRIVVDVSHTGRRTTLDAAEASSHPITANHANAIWLTPHRRNKTDEELKAIAATGGVVGITGINRFLLSSPSAPATLDDFVNHVEYMVEKIGIDHVGISSDSNMDGSHRYDVDYSEPLLCSFQRWIYVARRLRDRGYKREHLQKILGLNFKRVYERVLDP